MALMTAIQPLDVVVLMPRTVFQNWRFQCLGISLPNWSTVANCTSGAIVMFVFPHTNMVVIEFTDSTWLSADYSTVRT